MRDTKLILIEGMPGSGKSTAAQFLVHQMAAQGVPATWWYEEVRGHPLYVFDDAASMREVVEALFSGRHTEVVDAALEHWRTLVQTASSSDEVRVFDSCLFGYLTWSLFPADVPVEEIAGYVERVAANIAPLRPCVIHLREDDVSDALQRICERRGGQTEQRFVAQATGSPYGRRHGLAGFDGLVQYWTDYRAVTDELFERLPFAKLTIERTAGDWAARERSMLALLGLPSAAAPMVRPPNLDRFVGMYRRVGDEAEATCRVTLAGETLVVDGLPRVWPETPLLPRGDGLFAVASLPIEVAFRGEAAGRQMRMEVTGPAFLEGPVDCVCVREVP